MSKIIGYILARFRRHDWDVADAGFENGAMMTRLKCKRCGERRRYPTFNRDEFVLLYRMRGCQAKGNGQ